MIINKKTFLLKLLILLLLTISINGSVISESLENELIKDVVMELQKFNLDNTKREQLQVKLLKVLKYGVNDEYIMNLLKTGNTEKLKNTLNNIKEATDKNISVDVINNSLEKGNLNEISSMSNNNQNEIVTIQDSNQKVPNGLKFQKLEITPDNIFPGDIVKVSVEVKNISDSLINHKLILYANRKIFDIKKININRGETKKIKFSFIPFVKVNPFIIEVGNIKRRITIESYENNNLETINIKNNLKLKNNEKEEYNNKIIKIDGDIILEDNSKLIFNNCHVILKTGHTYDDIVILEDSSELIVKNTILKDTGPKIDIRMNSDNTKLKLSNSICEWPIVSGGEIDIESSVVKILMWHTINKVNIRDSKFSSIMISFRGIERKVKLNNLLARKRMTTNITTKEGKMNLHNTYVGGWELDIKAFQNDNIEHSHYILEDSEIGGIWLHFGENTEVKLNHLKPGYYKRWTLSEENEIKNSSFDLTLVNTYLDNTDYATTIKLYSYDKVNAKNIDFAQICTWDDGEFFVDDSNVYYNVLLRGQNDKIILKDTYVRNEVALIDGTRMMDDGGGDRHHIEFDNTIIEQPMVIESTYSKISGTVNFKSNQVDYRWGEVEREFPVIVKDQNGEKIEGIKLNFYNYNNELVDSKKTNKNGKVFFTINFNENSYNDSWLVKIDQMEKSKKIKLSSDTPIIIEKED